MKNVLLSLLCLVLVQFSYGQKGQVGDTRWSMGMTFDLLDQFTPELDGFQLFKTPTDLGLRAFVWANINSSLAIELGASTTGIRTEDIESPLEGKNLHLFNFDGGFVYKFNNGYIFKETAPVAPFLFVKARGTFMEYQRSNFGGQGWGVGIPVGGGINWRLQHNFALQTAVAYTFGITDNYENNLLFSVGFMFDLGNEKVVEVMEEPIVDTDEDGIIDENDECPQIPGLLEFNGCPDTDGDGITDAEDDCPAVAGLAAFNGCPDTDGDGIRDIDDDCPEVPGVAELNGCPIPDADSDGVPDADDDCPNIPGKAELRGCPDADGDLVPDKDDACPTEAGPATNRGCPEVHIEVIEKLEFAATAIQFELNSDVLKASSYGTLDEIVEILKEWKNYSVSIDGHTDSSGPEDYNQELSQKRAESAAAYLISKGIDEKRIVTNGFGESKPKADNSTPEGRRQNRRVEFNLFIP